MQFPGCVIFFDPSALKGLPVAGGAVFITPLLEPPGWVEHCLGDSRVGVQVAVVVFDVKMLRTLPPFA